MSFEIVFTLVVLAVTVVLFASGRLRVDLVALLILVALLLGGVISPSAALSGFSNPAVVTVAALLVLSAGLLRTGFGRIAAEALGGLAGRRPWMGLLGMMAFVGGILMGYGARLARGCTSGQALSGGAVLSAGSWVFMLAVFTGGYLLAWFVRRLWQPGGER